MPGQRLRTFRDCTKTTEPQTKGKGGLAKLDLDGRRAAGQHGATEALDQL